jgi:hypothetical protein
MDAFDPVADSRIGARPCVTPVTLADIMQSGAGGARFEFTGVEVVEDAAVDTNTTRQ